MKTLLSLIIKLFDLLHVFLISLLKENGIILTDKQMHFMILGIAFLFVFILIEYIFKQLAKLSVSVIAFVYVFTVSVVVALAIEIGQYQNKSGQMDFYDVTWGLYGVIVFILVFVIIRWILIKLYKLFSRNGGEIEK